MKQLAKAVVAVMKEVKGMEKNSRVGSGKMAYNGTKDQDVKEVFNEVMAKHGLCIMPIDIQQEVDITKWEETTNYGVKQKQSVFTKVNTKYLLLHESGESVELAGAGHGVDPQDKGAGKALTYALKNTLLYTFLTPVGKIDDSDNTHSEDIETPTIKKETPKPTTSPKKEPPTIEKCALWFEKATTLEEAKKAWDAVPKEYKNKQRITLARDKAKERLTKK